MRTEWAGERGKLKPPSTCDVSAPRSGGTRIDRIVHICLVAVALCSVAACTQRTNGHASPAASAFPDLSRYPLVEGDHHTEVTQQYFSGSTFSTPDGQSCSTNVRDYSSPAVVLRAAARQGRLLGHLVRTRRHRIHQAG